MQLPVVTEEHHEQYHQFFQSGKGKHPRQKLRSVADVLYKEDPGFFGFLEGVCGEFPLAAYAPYFMLKQAAGGSLPTIDDTVKATVLQESFEYAPSRMILSLIDKCPPVAKHFLETTTLPKLGKDLSPPEYTEIYERTKQFVLAYSMIERQLLGGGPTLDLNAGIVDPVLDAMPVITREHALQVRAVRDRVADTMNTKLLTAQIEKNDPELLRFYMGLTDGSGIAIPSAYEGYILAAGGKLPRISDAVKVQVVQEYGPKGSAQQGEKVRQVLDSIKANNVESISLVGDMIGAGQRMGGKDLARQVVLEHVLFYVMLERQIALNKENKK